MRFTRRRRPDDFTWTDRKLANFMRSRERARARHTSRYPLLPFDESPEELDPAAELERRRQLQHASDSRMRSHASDVWRQARRAYFACPRDVREAIQAAWRAWGGPADATYFLYVVERHNGARDERARQYQEAQQALRRQACAELDSQGGLFV